MHLFDQRKEINIKKLGCCQISWAYMCSSALQYLFPRKKGSIYSMHYNDNSYFKTNY